MFTLNPLPPQIDATLVQKLVRAEPATIGHFRDWGFMDPGIKAMQQDLRIAGTAVTVHQPGVDGTIVDTQDSAAWSRMRLKSRKSPG